MFRGRIALLTGVAIGAMLGAMEAAHAGAFLIREQSAQGQGLSTAGAAAGGAGLGSIFWNPAAVTDYAGVQFSGVISGVFPYAKSVPSGGAYFAAGYTRDSGNIGQSAAVPAAYFSYQANDQVWVSVAVNAPYGLTTRNPVNWAGSTYAETARLNSTNLSPSIAYKFNDMVSVAVGVQFQYFNAFLTQDASGLLGAATPLGTNTATLQGDSWGVGLTAGITLKPWAGSEIGIGYRSAVQNTLTGTFVMSALPVNAGAKLSLSTPNIVTFGFKQAINEQFTVLAGVEYDDWNIKNVRIANTGTGATISTLPFNYNDGWLFSLGGEYKWNPALTLRAGIAYEKSPIDNQNRRPFLPDSDRTWVSIGGSYKITNQLSADLAYSHLFAKNGLINIAPTAVPVTPGLVASTSAHVDILSAGINYRWDTPSTPVLAKY